jgi:hypothetical protein
MRKLTLLSAKAFALISGIVLGLPQTASALTWSWGYSRTGILASGTLQTNNVPDSSGFYLISGITGTRNGETITGLQPAGTPIPGNEPYTVDNLIRFNFAQLTGNGFGYSTSGGNYANPFFADFLSTPGYLEVFSALPIIPGADNLGPEDSELPITFFAAPIPEPSDLLGILTIVGLGIAGVNSQKKIEM